MDSDDPDCRRIAQRILEILNEPGDLRAGMQRVLSELKTGTGFDAVGIRLQSREDAPYPAPGGMPASFLLTENGAIEREAEGEPCRSDDASVKPACTCGLVLSAKPGEPNPLLTPAGTFWTNDAAPPPDIPAAEGRRAHPRDRCIKLGYASVALVPIRSQGETVGLIHINDRRKGRFTPETIALLEEIASSIGSALRRKRLETALADSERRFKALFAQSPWGVAVIDSLNGRIEEHNPKFAGIAGRSEEEMRRADWMSITHPDDVRKDLDEMARMNAGEIPGFRMEKRYLRPDGSVVWIDMTVAPLKLGAGASPRHLCMIQDITERKRMEETLIRSQTLDSLGNLAGGIAHDFNNILTTILGNISLLKTKLDGEALSLLSEAEEACAGAKALSNELLTFAKGGSPVLEDLDLRTVITQAAVFAARGTKTRCVFDLGEEPLMAAVDKDLVSRVIQNLVLNATQAMPQGGDVTARAEIVSLEAGGHPVGRAGRFIRVTLEDQGPGIKPGALAKVFDPYFSTKGVGRGLGLSICYSIMAKHGGNIHAESRPGTGAVFVLHFPRAGSATAPAPSLKREGRAPVTGGRILIMDDEAVLSRVLKRIVEHLGFEADAAANGRDALEAYGRELEAGRPYDAVIMDLTVAGGMGGVEMLEKLKALDPGARTIVSSGYAGDPVMADHARHGFSGKLVKPYNIAQVSEALRRVLGRS